MKIVAVADIHGSYGAVERILDREQPFDVVVVAGDVTTKGTPGEMGSALRAILSRGRPVVAVAGNMDPPLLEQSLLDLGVSLNGRGVVIGDAGFFGVSASPATPFHTPYEIGEEEIARRAEAGWAEVASARWKIFVPHAPPHRTRLDRTFWGMHVGSTAVRHFIERTGPHVVVCGHIHEARGVDAIGETQMVNCGPAAKGSYAVVSIEETAHVECRELSRRGGGHGL